MIQRCQPSPSTPRLIVAGALLLAGIGLSGCAAISDSVVSQAFVDPAKYDYYDCKRLDSERKGLASRTAELNGLIAKAETGVGGAVVAEVAYRNEYISVRGQARLAEQAWRTNRCTESHAAAPASPTAPAPPIPAASPSPSGGAVY